jgi:hypothetical protein
MTDYDDYENRGAFMMGMVVIFLGGFVFGAIVVGITWWIT